MKVHPFYIKEITRFKFPFKKSSQIYVSPDGYSMLEFAKKKTVLWRIRKGEMFQMRELLNLSFTMIQRPIYFSPSFDKFVDMKNTHLVLQKPELAVFDTASGKIIEEELNVP